jgi:DNA-binding NtrC family response regulator
MIVLVQANILTAGLNGENQALEELPVHLVKVETAAQAARALKSENVDVVICPWDLVDCPDGLFVKRLRTAKPQVKIIVIIRAGSITEEIGARSSGVCAVLTNGGSDELLCQTLIAVLKLKEYAGAEKR